MKYMKLVQIGGRLCVRHLMSTRRQLYFVIGYLAEIKFVFIYQDMACVVLSMRSMKSYATLCLLNIFSLYLRILKRLSKQFS